jgi:hypothetical protein
VLAFAVADTTFLDSSKCSILGRFAGALPFAADDEPGPSWKMFLEGSEGSSLYVGSVVRLGGAPLLTPSRTFGVGVSVLSSALGEAVINSE